MTPDQRFWTMFHGLIVPVFIEIAIMYLALVVVVYGTIFLLNRHHGAPALANETRTRLQVFLRRNQTSKVDNYPQEEELKALTK